MKKRFALVAIGLLLLAITAPALGQGGGNGETVYSPDSLIRLHVVSNSDSYEDQALKRKVRDEIIAAVGPALAQADNVDSARRLAGSSLDRIHDVAAARIGAEGKDYPVEVELNRFSFPTKHYGPFVLPAGDYEAVRVTIGSGAGANWWCVLFPPLCFVDMTRTTVGNQPPDGACGQIDGTGDGAADGAAIGASAGPAGVADGTAAARGNVAPESRPSCSAVLQTGAGGSEKGFPGLPADQPGRDQIVVEYRFKVLDFFKNLFW